ncbi:hypothetical protein IEQ34_026614 [Dendrobium chrysotoxum]|uniref:Uncharacterized protein n=1 Tax=Dendrobium chrysotoxum TaxID=161865 RepID=A0AAV7FMF9_DENCH|nr:hypothetical protein IEQ34_026614 [Dendrobium chrysotoxum]
MARGNDSRAQQRIGECGLTSSFGVSAVENKMKRRSAAKRKLEAASLHQSRA